VIDVWKVAQATLTEKELHAYTLRHRHRLSLRQIALALDLSVSSVRSRLENCDRKMTRALTREAA
jgi:DNA-directed RNA polymerase specialized sigma24 family protein